MKNVLLITLLLFTSLNALSQVTIGLDEKPAEGTLLQLKNKNVTGQTANSTKGLLLPRVELDPDKSATGNNLAEKLVKSLQITLPPGTIIDTQLHTGLTVYNTASGTIADGAPFAGEKICPGVYIWDGAEWVRYMFKDCQ
ncbi:hypothetical protein [Dysgonomonas sp.]